MKTKSLIIILVAAAFAVVAAPLAAAKPTSANIGASPSAQLKKNALADAVTSFAGTAGLAASQDHSNRLAEGHSNQVSPPPMADAVTSFAGTAGLAAPQELMNQLAAGHTPTAGVPDFVDRYVTRVAANHSAATVTHVQSTSTGGYDWTYTLMLSGAALIIGAALTAAYGVRRHRTIAVTH
jgi:hypothetical protein